MKNEKIVLVGFIVVCLLAGFLGSFFTASAIPTWYSGLNKPFFNPPNWLFAPVWTALYIMMAIAGFLAWKEGWGVKNKKNIKTALTLFFVQLFLNFLWSVLFFGMKNPFLAFIEIIILWIFIILTTIQFYKISKNAAYLMIPYILWVSFATILNYSIWILN
ncbi:tryptophan-rich sensory protein [Candidatus Micrarchaeota archaeon]|nr:tryptophan-rich sensory protein [Candidatus Micrarchaeota archaeon]